MIEGIGGRSTLGRFLQSMRQNVVGVLTSFQSFLATLLPKMVV